ncbi:MAG: membrane protein insertase YidC [Helicobacteraceae bacterium]|nr:membrane protein insertase YidC [Helicobacteraceae bacterium]
MNNNSNSRILLAIVLSLLFLIPYMYFFAPKTEHNDANATIAKASSSNIAQNQESDKIDSINAPSNVNISDVQAPISTDNSKIITKIESSNIEINIDNLGRIASVFLKDKKYLQDGKPLSLLDSNNLKPLEIRFQNKEINEKAFRMPYKANISDINLDNGNTELILTQDLGEINGIGNITIKKILTFYDNFKYDIRIELNKPLEYFISNGARPVADSSAYVFKGVIIKKADNKLEKIEEGDSLKGENPIFNNAKFVASVDRYYSTLFFNENGFDVIMDIDSKENLLSYIALNDSASFSGYIGPKNYQELKDISPILTDVVEYGVITFFAKPLFLLLEWLFDIFKNWGWAIIGLTLIVRIVLYPLTYKGMMSMQKLKDLAPKMKDIQTKYKGDSQKLQLHMMELYKKHKVNPMGGCLPLLLQIPVFFAIYRVLYNAVELKDAAWLLWIKDLSAMDPYFILPILMGATMYLQQRITPATFNDPMQEKIFKFLPLVFTIFLITFPAGLILYWTVNNIFSIIQQLIINKIMEKKKIHEMEEKSVKN